MTTMLEKAARAMAEADPARGWQHTSYLAMARAALQAIRVPSRTEQVWAMDGRLSKCSPDVAEGWRQEYERNWTAMIDAILSEEA